MEIKHTTVLKKEAADALEIKNGGTYIDATFGLGGHTVEIISRKKDIKVIGIEVDKEIYDYAKHLFKHNKNILLYNNNFIDIDNIIVSCGLAEVDGIIFDLGTNLYQIKESGRGFSFLKNEKLDMRLDKNSELTAEKVINSYSREELEELLRKVDERFYHPIARKITEFRRKKRIKTTDDLVEIIRSVKGQRGRINPATLTFMALRIEVNRELSNLEEALIKTLDLVKKGGRVVVISFHSGEDRIVKNFFKNQSKAGVLRIVNKKVVIPNRSEMIINPLSRSAKMRVAEKI